jgi:hypothetical protein
MSSVELGTPSGTLLADDVRELIDRRKARLQERISRLTDQKPRRQQRTRR